MTRKKETCLASNQTGKKRTVVTRFDYIPLAKRIIVSLVMHGKIHKEIAVCLKTSESICRKSATFLQTNAVKAKVPAGKVKGFAVFLPYQCRHLKTSSNGFWGRPDRRSRRTWDTKPVFKYFGIRT